MLVSWEGIPTQTSIRLKNLPPSAITSSWRSPASRVPWWNGKPGTEPGRAGGPHVDITTHEIPPFVFFSKNIDANRYEEQICYQTYTFRFTQLGRWAYQNFKVPKFVVLKCCIPNYSWLNLSKIRDRAWLVQRSWPSMMTNFNNLKLLEGRRFPVTKAPGPKKQQQCFGGEARKNWWTSLRIYAGSICTYKYIMW